jgi:hypothetical protein
MSSVGALFALAAVLAAWYAAVTLARFRGLLLPAFPRKPGGRVRRLLRISSFLPRWASAGYFSAAWSLGLAAAYGAFVCGEAYRRAFTGSSVVDHVMNTVGWFVALLAFFLAVGYAVTIPWLYQRVRRREQERYQRSRDLRAAATLAAVESGAPGEHGPYSVWLRPFNSTGRCWVIAKSRKAGKRDEPARDAGYHVNVTDIETMLATAMEPIAPLVALGTSGEQVGAGRVEVPGDRWQDTFAVLARSAHAIFLLPSQRAGTRWEIDFLLRERGLLDRVVFIVPPAFLASIDTVMAVHLGPGPRALGNLRGLSRQMYGGGRRASGTRELRSRTQAVQRQAVREVLASGFGEGHEAREEALRMLRDLLPQAGYRRVTDAARGAEFSEGGALVKLSNNGTVSVASAVALRTHYPAWYHYYFDGPRFDQRLFRTGILRLL